MRIHVSIGVKEGVESWAQSLVKKLGMHFAGIYKGKACSDKDSRAFSATTLTKFFKERGDSP